MPEYGNPWPVPKTNNGEGMNQAQWHAIYEDWATKMMGMGYKVDDLPGIAQQAGEIFPKDLVSSIKAKNTLFPGADMGYRYDLAGGQKQRPVSYSDPSLGYGDWVPMEPSEIQAANSYHSWANNPANAGYESQFGDNNYNAWLASQHGMAPPRAGSTGFGGTYNGPFPWTQAGSPGSATQALAAQGVNSGTLGGILKTQFGTTTPGATSFNAVGSPGATGLGALAGTEDWKKKYDEAL